jgi:hypothetical protein
MSIAAETASFEGAHGRGAVRSDEKVYLRNSQARLLHLPDCVKRDDKGQVIIGLGVPHMVMPSAPIKKDGSDKAAPILTAVPLVYWNEIKSNPIVRSWMMMGWLSIVEANDNVLEQGERVSLDKFNEQTAECLIGGEEDVVLLRSWLAAETRPPVRMILERRLEAVEAERARRGGVPSKRVDTETASQGKQAQAAAHVADQAAMAEARQSDRRDKR